MDTNNFLAGRWGLVLEILAPALIAAWLLLTGLAPGHSLDGHEALVGQTAREMVRSGDWIHPTFAGEPRLEKPPLAYWCVAACYRLFRTSNETLARLPSALALLISTLILAGFGRRSFGVGAGFWIGTVHATMWAVLESGRSALVDAELTLLVLLGILLGTWNGWAHAREWNHWASVGFWLACGLAVLAKGPVGLVMIILTVVLFRTLFFKQKPDQRLLSGVGGFLGISGFLLLVLVWPMLLLRQHPEALQVWFEQSWGRFRDHFGPQTRPWYYYFGAVAWMTLPWLPAWLLGVFQPMETRPRESLRRLMIIWFLVCFVLLSMSEGKRAHYLLPGLPPLAVLAGIACWRATLHRQCGRAFDAMKFGIPWKTARFGLSCLIALESMLLIGSGMARERSGLRELVKRESRRIQSAERLYLVGARCRELVFLADRPTKWLIEPTQECLRPNTIIVTPEPKIPALMNWGSFRVAARTDRQLGFSERHPKERFALLEPLAVSRSIQTVVK